jgi:hypothetical protein
MDGSDLISSTCDTTIAIGSGGDDTITASPTNPFYGTSIIFGDDMIFAVAFDDSYGVWRFSFGEYGISSGRDTLTSSAALSVMVGGENEDTIRCTGNNCYIGSDNIILTIDRILDTIHMVPTIMHGTTNDDIINISKNGGMTQTSVVIAGHGNDLIETKSDLSVICSDHCDGLYTSEPFHTL